MKHSISAIALLSLTSALFAQGNTPPELPTTVVTGDLWESELQKTTASVTVLDEAVLEANGTQHFEDIINTIPNLTWTGGTSRPRYIQIRGIGENSQFEGETPDSSVRFLIDDLDLTGLGTVGNLFDVQQVEVLRGPQAGAFGANAAGGVIRIVTNEPTPYWTGQAETSFGSDNLMTGGIAVGGPLLESNLEKLTFRLSVHQLLQDGFRDNRFLDREDTNQRDELTSQFKLRWLPSDDLQWDAAFFYAIVDNGYDEFSLDNTEFDTYSDEPGEDGQTTTAGSLRGRWSGLDSVDITTVSAYALSDSDYSYDADWTDAADPRSYDGFLGTFRERDVISQEIRFDSSEKESALGWIDRWTFGLYFNSLNEDTVLDYEDVYATARLSSTYKADTYATFGQIAHGFSESTRLIMGLRYERHQVDFSSTTIDDYFGSLLAGTNKSKKNNDLVGGKITLEHDLSESQMLFSGLARGYKAGGANSGAFRYAFDPETYEDEVNYNFELGLRSQWFDSQLSSSITMFYLLRKNTQLRDSRGSGGFFRYLTVNGEDAYHYGLEAEIKWHISDNWTAYASTGLLETDRDAYQTTASDEDVDPALDGDSVDDPITVDVASRKLSNAPSYSYQFGIRYDKPEGLFGSVELTGKGDYYESNSHDEKRSRFNLVNASIGYKIDNWTITLWAKNLFDERYEKRVFFFGNEEPAYPIKRYESPADPRTFGVTAKYSW